MNINSGLILIILILWGCKSSDKVNLTIPEDTLVKIMTDIYAIKSAVNLNHPSYKDSTALAYFDQLSKVYGYTPEEIQRNLESLALDIDSMIIIQNMALDTLRVFNERRYQTQYSTGNINN